MKVLGFIFLIALLFGGAFANQLVESKLTDRFPPIKGEPSKISVYAGEISVDWINENILKKEWTKEEVAEVRANERQKVMDEYAMRVASSNTPSPFSRTALIRAINEIYVNKALKGLGEATVLAGETIGVNPRVIAGIASYESRGQNASGTWIVGNSWNSTNLNNISGMNATSNRKTKWNGEPYNYGSGGRDNRYVKYPSVSESLFDLSYRLKKVYIDHGLETLSDIGKKYAPTNDRWEGLYGMTNHGWDTRVQHYYDRITDLAVKYTAEESGN